MAGSDSGHDLLFGTFALQLQFISREAFLAASTALVHEKGKSLGQVLVERGALNENTRQLLEALIKNHLGLHGDKMERSLAAVRSARCDDVHATRAPVGEATGLSESRFRILRPHARGGLGEVYVALDNDLHREVAIKEIQPHQAASPESRQRFLMEAEITGGLEHPGIVPVYGLGASADGRPYYIMRFIKGDSLKEAIDCYHAKPPGESSSRAGSLRKLLRHFIDVCNAVAYAHSRGVLHRDLKPANIMLGAYGETLVVDWGLAKTGIKNPEALDTEEIASDRTAEMDAPGLGERPLQPVSASGSMDTLAGSAIGTPQYMSPEQAAGRTDLLGPASDVYSLGATLYCLLTGKPPFDEEDLGTLLRKVERGDFPRPRVRRSDVPRSLEAVCLKAMSRSPGARYRSPRELADDIERWLADEPTSAWSEPVTVRFRRWLAKHRTHVTTAAAVAVLALASLTIANVWLSRAHDQERAAKDAALRREAEMRRLYDDALNTISELRRAK